MIRRRDQWRLSVQKLGLRKRRAAFAIVSVALGVIVVVTVNSLLGGVRDVALRTMWTEELDKDVVKVYATDNPYEYVSPDEQEKQKKKRRFQFLSEKVFAELRQWPEVEAADHPVIVHTLSVSAFTNCPRPITSFRGVPVALLRKYATADRLAACTNVIPLIVAERSLRLRLDAKKHKLEFDKSPVADQWIGRDVTIRLGDNLAALERFRFDYEKKEYHEFTADEQAAQRESLQRSYASQYDSTIYNRVLPLQARIVGVCPGGESLLPLDTARLCEKWLDQRRLLAELQPHKEPSEPVYEAQGRLTPREGEFTDGLVVVRHAAAVEKVAKRIEDMGFRVATRALAFDSQVKSFDSGLKVVKLIVYGFGGMILAIAGALVWSTTSRLVSDSRTDIGLFRALGATKTDIRRLFLSEAALLGILGTFLGTLLGWALACTISHYALRFARREVSQPEEMLLIPDTIFAFRMLSCLALLAGAAVVSSLAGWWPARRAANIDPVKALKRE